MKNFSVGQVGEKINEDYRMVVPAVAGGRQEGGRAEMDFAPNRLQHVRSAPEFLAITFFKFVECLDTPLHWNLSKKGVPIKKHQDFNPDDACRLEPELKLAMN